MAISMPLNVSDLPQQKVGSYQAVGGQIIMVKDVVFDSERTRGLRIRAEWMRKMGLSEEEIAEARIDDGSPVNLDEERENLRCVLDLKVITPPISVLKSWAVER